MIRLFVLNLVGLTLIAGVVVVTAFWIALGVVGAATGQISFVVVGAVGLLVWVAAILTVSDKAHR